MDLTMENDYRYPYFTQASWNMLLLCGTHTGAHR